MHLHTEHMCFFPVWLELFAFHIPPDVAAIFCWLAAVVPLPNNNRALMRASRRGCSLEPMNNGNCDSPLETNWRWTCIQNRNLTWFHLFRFELRDVIILWLDLESNYDQNMSELAKCYAMLCRLFLGHAVIVGRHFMSINLATFCHFFDMSDVCVRIPILRFAFALTWIISCSAEFLAGRCWLSFWYRNMCDLILRTCVIP